jgi:hypothetical protein
MLNPITKNTFTYALIITLLSGVFSLNIHGAFAGSETGYLGDSSTTDAEFIGDDKYKVVNVEKSVYTDPAGKKWFKAKTVLKPRASGFFYFKTDEDRKKFIAAVNGKEMTFKEISKAAADNGGKTADS